MRPDRYSESLGVQNGSDNLRKVHSTHCSWRKQSERSGVGASPHQASRPLWVKPIKFLNCDRFGIWQVKGIGSTLHPPPEVLREASHRYTVTIRSEGRWTLWPGSAKEGEEVGGLLSSARYRRRRYVRPMLGPEACASAYCAGGSELIEVSALRCLPSQVHTTPLPHRFVRSEVNSG